MSLTQLIAGRRQAWHGVKLSQPDWGEHSHSVAFTAGCETRPMTVHVILNALLGAARIRTAADRRHLAALDGHVLPAPEDIVEWQKAPASHASTYRAGPRSVVVLYAVSG